MTPPFRKDETMTVKELKQYIERLPDDAEVCFEYDGPDTYTYKRAGGFIIADDDSSITLVEEVE